MAVYFVGIDWASKTHYAAVVDDNGGQRESFAFANSARGFAVLTERITVLTDSGEVAIGIEKHRGPLFRHLRSLRCKLYEIPPHRVAGRRRGESASRAKSDPGDASLIANFVRTEWRQMAVASTTSSDTLVIDQVAKERLRLTQELHSHQMTLRALLEQFFPAMLEVWENLAKPCALRFIKAYPTADLARQITPESIREVFTKIDYRVKRNVDELAETLRNSISAVDDDALRGVAPTIVRLADRMLLTVEQLGDIDRQQKELTQKNDDAKLTLSFPCIQANLASHIVAALGSDRQRFENFEHACAYAGVVPVTIASGKRRYVQARLACNTALRRALIQHAFITIRHVPWAKQKYDAARRRGKDHYTALRILARSWFRILFKCWRDRSLYDINKHSAAADAAAKALAAA